MKSLKQRYDFMRLKREGKIARSCHWFFVCYQKNQIKEFRLGLTVPKYCGKAVTRNKLKRWCKEFFRNRDEKPDFDVNIIFKRMPQDFYEDIKHSFLESNLQSCLRKIR